MLAQIFQWLAPNTKPCSLKVLNAADQLHLKIFLKAPTCFAFCHRPRVAQGCKTLQRPPAHQVPHSWRYLGEHKLHLGSQAPPGAESGDPFHQQVPRRTSPTNGGRKELPGEGVWLKQLAGARYRGGNNASSPVVTVLSFFCFLLCLDPGNSGPDETTFRVRLKHFPVKQKSF